VNGGDARPRDRMTSGRLFGTGGDSRETPWRLVERPLLRLKDRFGYRVREAEAAPAIVGGYGPSPERRPHESAPIAGSIH
jgi:hypothetical protein